jgi:hypothetical protein
MARVCSFAAISRKWSSKYLRAREYALHDNNNNKKASKKILKLYKILDLLKNQLIKQLHISTIHNHMLSKEMRKEIRPHLHPYAASASTRFGIDSRAVRLSSTLRGLIAPAAL